MGCMYQAVNTYTGKKYIGVTVGTLDKRRNQHERAAKRGSDYYFHKALMKHGPQAFVWKELLSHSDAKYLYEAERRYLHLLTKAGVPLYNTAPGGKGGSVKGRVHGATARTRLRGEDHHLWGGKQSLETRLKRSGEQHGRAKLTDESVLSLRGEFLAGKSLTALSKDFGIGITTVSHITQGNTWSHVGWPIAYG